MKSGAAKDTRVHAAALAILLTCVFGLRVQCAQLNLGGRVVDRAGTPIPNAQVDLYSATNAWHAITDSSGRFSFPSLVPGIYDLEFTKVGFRKQIIQSERIGSPEHAPINVTLLVATPQDSCGDSFSNIDYVDSPGHSGIKGVVKIVANANSPKGAGSTGPANAVNFLSGINVSASKAGAKSKPTSARTNQTGEFHLSGLNPGLYSLKASRKGYADFAMSNVRVPPGTTLEVQFVMQPSGSLTVCQ